MKNTFDFWLKKSLCMLDVLQCNQYTYPEYLM